MATTNNTIKIDDNIYNEIDMIETLSSLNNNSFDNINKHLCLFKEINNIKDKILSLHFIKENGKLYKKESQFKSDEILHKFQLDLIEQISQDLLEIKLKNLDILSRSRKING